MDDKKQSKHHPRPSRRTNAKSGGSPLRYALAAPEPRERSKSRSFGKFGAHVLVQRIREFGREPKAQDRIEYAARTAKSGLDHVRDRHAVRFVFEAQDESSGEPHAPDELPGDLLAWNRGGHNRMDFQAETTDIFIHVNQVADIACDLAHSVKSQVNPGPPGLIAGVVAVQHEVGHFTAVQAGHLYVGLQAYHRAALRKPFVLSISATERSEAMATQACFLSPRRG
ncbi:MAG: hypothetical protein K2Z80_35335 [Xanthobacteraceae bacterium]|nr:hypothetical protein [Xanthobacteraceae bacterium]